MLGWFARRWWCASVLAIGCNAGDTSAIDGGDDSVDTSTTQSVSGSVGDTDSDTDPMTGGAASEGPGLDTTDDGADEDNATATGAEPEACGGIDCGKGSCVTLDGETPACECDPGFAPIGLTCVPCEAHPSDAALDIPVMRGAIELTVSGLVPPKSDYEDATVWLRNRHSGDAVLLGNTHDDGPFAFAVVRGNYDVVYEHESGGNVLPRNARAVLGQITPDDVVEGGTLAIDIPVVRVHGTITLDGAAPPASAYDSGRLWLRDRTSGDEVLLGDTHEGTIEARVRPGTYMLHYALRAGGNGVPANRDAPLVELTIAPDDEDGAMQLDVDVPSVAIEGTITIGGLEPPASAYENGRLRLVGSGDDEVVLGDTKDGAYQTRVVPGFYDVVYQRVAGSMLVPANARAVLTPAPLELRIDSTMPIDVPVVTLAGVFTVNEAVPPVDPSDDGLVTLRTDAGDEVVLGNTADGSYTRRVVPGIYDAYYGQDQSAGGVPTNTNARVAADIDVTKDDAARDIDIGLVVVTGEILLAGAPPPTSDYDDGYIYLRNTDTGDSALLASTRAGGFTAAVVPGLYDVVYVVETAGPAVPINAAAVLDTVDVAASPSFDVDVPVVPLGGPLSIDGAAPPTSTADFGIVALRDAKTGDELVLGATSAGQFAQPVTPGEYLVFYRMQASTGVVPRNTNANLGCWSLDP